MTFRQNRRGFGDRRIGGSVIARTVRKFKVKEVPLSEIKDDLSRYLREAETQEICFHPSWQAGRHFDRIRI